jgi:hypothetical protein
MNWFQAQLLIGPDKRPLAEVAREQGWKFYEQLPLAPRRVSVTEFLQDVGRVRKPDVETG